MEGVPYGLPPNEPLTYRLFKTGTRYDTVASEKAVGQYSKDPDGSGHLDRREPARRGLAKEKGLGAHNKVVRVG